MNFLIISPADNVAVALENLNENQTLDVNGIAITIREEIQRGHKFAIKDIESGEKVIKYGFPIGNAYKDIKCGEWVHTHNIKTALDEEASYTYEPMEIEERKTKPLTFEGFRRKDGNVAIRNEIWIIPTVGCVNSVAQKLAQYGNQMAGDAIDGVYSFSHPYGCSQMGEDHQQTRKILADLIKHPNGAGVLVVGLGCENLTQQQLKDELGRWDDERVKFLVCQDCEDEFEEGKKLIDELIKYAGNFKREAIDAGELIIGMKCGGSDGLSGITANPTVGRFSDLLISMGGTTVLTEVPEMFGAEDILFQRCVDRETFEKAVSMVEDFKEYYISHNQVVYENPSPGNKAGGISTLEDKSCGCVQKGGNAPVRDVLKYGERVKTKGLNLLSGPGNDLVSATALTAAGAHMILFTTGRGTPFGAPAPTVKISSNSQLKAKKSNWIDFDAGTVANGESIDDAGERLLEYVLSVASGKQTLTEENGFRDIAIFKDGVTL